MTIGGTESTATILITFEQVTPLTSPATCRDSQNTVVIERTNAEHSYEVLCVIALPIMQGNLRT